MNKPLKLALIGLDTSHSVEFPKLMQAPEIPESKRVSSLRAVSCMSFETPFQNREGLAKRKAQLEAWGVKVTDSFEEAVAGVDAILLEINDPSLHLEYFRKAANLGKRVFIDKPLADTAASAREIIALARANGVEAMSCSSLRYMPALDTALSAVPKPDHGSFFGPVGKAPAGSSIVWYGVHTVEMLVKGMGLGATEVRCVRNGDSFLLQVFYNDKRQAIAELVEGAYAYGGSLRCRNSGAAFSGPADYEPLLWKIEIFLRTGETDASLEKAYEVTALLQAAERSLNSGKTEEIER